MKTFTRKKQNFTPMGIEARVSQIYQEAHNDRTDTKKDNKGRRIIREANDVNRLPFYCLKCKSDFVGVCIKQTEDGRIPIAYYKTYHDCGTESIRRITDKKGDEYYTLSPLMGVEYQKSKDDTLTPEYGRFQTLYGRPWEDASMELKILKEYEHKQIL
mgnify:CR=1 FL=1